ncbi:DNA-processing protein DprA [Rhodovulum bhavnagarense]
MSSCPPLAPPPREDALVSWLRLIRSRRVGPATFHRLMGDHGSAEAALEALPRLARDAGVSDYMACSADLAHRELECGRRLGAVPLIHGGPGYPGALMDLPDAPPFLWALGRVGLTGRPMVALVGARNASSLGTRMARRMAEGLSAAGFSVVSGLARGIDRAAHMAALERGTVAVQAGGIDVPYPAENTQLCHEIGEKGLRLSENPVGLQPQARHFPQRNRIISGLALAVVVVEAAARSGSLITAKNALDQGREVLAVPGHPLDARAAGCNMLIRDGAVLVRGPDDVLEILSGTAAPALPGMAEVVTPPVSRPHVPDTPAPRLRATEIRRMPGSASPDAHSKTASLHRQILDRLGPSPLAEDQLIRDIGLPPGHVAPALVTLELDGRIERAPGGFLSRRI